MAMMALIGIIVSAAACLTGIIMIVAHGRFMAPMEYVFGGLHLISAGTSGYMIFPIYRVWIQFTRENIYWLLLAIVLMVLVLNTIVLLTSTYLCMMYLKPISWEFMYRPVYFYNEKPEAPKPEALKQPMPMMMMAMPHY